LTPAWASLDGRLDDLLPAVESGEGLVVESSRVEVVGGQLLPERASEHIAQLELHPGDDGIDDGQHRLVLPEPIAKIGELESEREQLVVRERSEHGRRLGDLPALRQQPRQRQRLLCRPRVSREQPSIALDRVVRPARLLQQLREEHQRVAATGLQGQRPPDGAFRVVEVILVVDLHGEARPRFRRQVLAPVEVGGGGAPPLVGVELRGSLGQAPRAMGSE